MVTIESYNPNWPKQFAWERVYLLRELGSRLIAIEHIGSTAVPGLAAKPVIDILVGVASLELIDQAEIQVLKALGYEYIKAFEEFIPDRRYFQKLDPMGEHLVHVHIVKYADSFWQCHILFRDYLIAHPAVAKEYEQLKIQLAAQYSNDRKSYTQSKTLFVEQVVKDAKMWNAE